MIYQKHPNHGRHFAANDREERENIKNGWVTVTEEEFYESNRNRDVVLVIEKDEGPKLSELKESYLMKFGKKAPSNMKLETLKEKVGE